MPRKRGPGTHKGFLSPKTTGYPPEVRDHIRRVYGAYREKHPQEDPRVKARAARIAWTSAKRHFPDIFRKHSQLIKGTAIEAKEHPSLSKQQAGQVAADHIKENPRAYLEGNTILTEPIHIRPAKTAKGRKRQVRDLHAAARQERRWAGTAENEKVSEGKRSKTLRKRGLPIMAQDTARDAKLAGDFAKARRRKADQLDLEAARIAEIKG